MGIFMDTIDDISKSINSFVKPIFEDKVGAAVLSLVIVLYAGLAAPKLPHAIAKLFSNKIFKLLVLVFVAYTASKNTSIAIISAVALVISMQPVSEEKIEAAGLDESTFATYKPESIESEEPLNTTEEDKLLVAQAKKEVESELNEKTTESKVEVTESEVEVTESEVVGSLEDPQTDLNASVTESEPVETVSVKEPEPKKVVEEP